MSKCEFAHAHAPAQSEGSREIFEGVGLLL